MPWSNGVFTRTDGVTSGTQVWTNARDSADKRVLAPTHDAHDQDIADGLEALLLRDGKNSPTANLPMAGFNHTGVGNATSRDQYAALAQVLDAGVPFAAAGGTPDAMTGAFSPPFPAFVDGMSILLRANGEPTINNPTFTLDALAAKTITRPDGSTLRDKDYINGYSCLLIYSASADRWILNNPQNPDTVITAQGDLIIGDATNLPSRLGIGAGGTLLVSDGTTLSYQTVPTILDTVLGSTQGSIATRNATAWTSLAPGTAGQLLETGGAGADPSWVTAPTAQTITRGTPQATTSGTSFNFSGITGTDRITVVLDSVSLSGNDSLLIQIGPSGGVETTGYVSASTRPIPGSSTSGGSTNVGFLVYLESAVSSVSANVVLTRIDGNTWICSHSGLYNSTTDTGLHGGGTKTLAGTLTQLTLTRTGTDTFDAGKVNVFFE